MIAHSPHLQHDYASRQDLLGTCLGRAPREWLSEREAHSLRSIKSSRRRNDWLAGRWLAKQLVQEHLGESRRPLGDIDICSRDEAGRGARPEIQLNGKTEPWSLSLSHSSLGVIVALSVTPGVRVGVDLVPVESFSGSWFRTWFTSEEQLRLRDASVRDVSRTWACKEAIYKAVHSEETFMPRRFDVDLSNKDRIGCHYSGQGHLESIDVTTCDIDEQVAALCVMQTATTESTFRQPILTHPNGSDTR